ncbi:MAG: CBS domain-containing protein [Myxococcales bacterium]|nr:CBS domain-containing protein [Myxococcales bacterium]
MTRTVIVIPPEVTLDLAWGLMQTHRIRHLPVVRSGELLGILSDRDVLLHASVGGDGSVVVPAKPVGAVMTPAPFTITPDTSVATIVRLFTERKIDAAPVISDNGRLIGLVTSTDLLLLLLDPAQAQPLPFEWQVVESSSAAVS